MNPADDVAIAESASTEDLVEKWVHRALKELREGNKDMAEDLLVDILFLIGRGPRA